jgi:hypothetical protein
MRPLKNYKKLNFLRAPGSSWRAAALVSMLLLCWNVSPVFAQVAQFGQITGLVTDPSGGVIAGAKVNVTNESTEVERETSTNADGNYLVSSLLPGTYDVTVSRTGFVTQTRIAIRLDVAQIARVDMTLKVGAVSQHVTVKSAVALLQTQSASVGTVVTGSAVINLPLNGRNYIQLATLSPGVYASVLSGTTDDLPNNELIVNGTRSSAVMYLIDGANVQDQFNSGSDYTPAPDALQEFKIESNSMSAAYGSGGEIINAVLKSGTNQFHGDAYEFFRNTSLDTRNFFATTTPQLNQNQFGFTFGGPIKKNKVFFFGDFEGTRILSGETFDSPVPTVAERGGDFTGVKQLKNPFTGLPLTPDVIPQAQFSPQTSFFLPYIPPPNNPSGTYLVTTRGTNYYNQGDIRLDYQLRPSDSLTFTYSFEPGSFYEPGALPTNGGITANYLQQLAALEWTHSIGPNIVNEARVTYTRQAGHSTEQGAGTNYTEEAGIGGYSLTSLEDPGFPELEISGYTGINGVTYNPFTHIFNPFIIGDALTMVKGKHTLEAGADAMWWSGAFSNSAYSRGLLSFTGTYTGNGFGDFLYGAPYQGYRDFPRNLFGQYEQTQDVFFQDSWKASRRLTLIGGLRYDLIHPRTELGNGMASTDIVLNKIIVATDSNCKINANQQQVEKYALPVFQSMIVPSCEVGLGPSLQRLDASAFGPRSGIAYDLGHGFVGRAGYGIFYPLPMENENTVGIINPPFIVDELSNFNTTPLATMTAANLFPPLTTGQLFFTAPTFSTLDPYFPDPYVQEWNFTLQKVVSGVLSLQAGYVGSKGTHLNFQLPLNVPTPGPGAIQSRRFNTFWGAGTEYQNTAEASYNALQVTAETRDWHGLFLLGAYTWSKSLDNDSLDSATPVENPYNLLNEWGVSDYNIPSRFTLSMTYALPLLRNRSGIASDVLGGWRVANIITLQSGLPFTPTISTDQANTGRPQRPNRIGSGILANPTINDWFNVSAFAVPPQYTYGTAARNVLMGPPLDDWDFSLFKTFTLSHAHEGIRAQFRGEFFNFSNTPAFGAPDGDIQDVTAGKVLSAGAPREVQLVFKILF